MGYILKEKEDLAFFRPIDVSQEETEVNHQSAYLAAFIDRHPYFFDHMDDYADRKPCPLALDAEIHGNEMRFINNSRFPNAKKILAIKAIASREECRWTFKFEFATYYVAMRDIEIGEEILADYGWIDQVIKAKKIIDFCEKKMCFKCMQTNKKLNSKCKMATYCNTDCRKKDTGHAKYCNK